MSEFTGTREIAREKDPWRIHEGLWTAMSHGNKYAKQKELAPFEEIVNDIHRCIVKPVVDPKYLYLLEGYRTRDAIVLGGIVHPAKWMEIPELMADYSQNVTEMVSNFKKRTTKSVSDFIDLASYAHYRFYKIHPYLDGHKRTGRQLVDILAKHLGFESILVTIDKKNEYLDSMQMSTQTRDPRYFSIFQSEVLAEAYVGKKDSEARGIYESAMNYRAFLIREVSKAPQKSLV